MRGQILAAQPADVERLRQERDHWKANHDAQVQRARVLIERTDMPLERVAAYKQIGALREQLAVAQAQVEAMRRDAERLSFLDAQASPGYGWAARSSVTGRGYRLHQASDAKAKTVREAIDAALAQQKGGA